MKRSPPEDRSGSLFLRTMVVFCLLVFFLFSQNSEISNCASPMNSSLYTPKEDTHVRPYGRSCFYCQRKFSSNQALGGHLRVHWNSNIIKSCAGSSSTPSHITGISNNSLSNGLLDISSRGAGKVPLPSREVSSLGFPGIFHSPATSMADTSKFPVNKLGNSISLSMPLSGLSLNGVAEMHHSDAAPSSAAGTSASHAFTGISSGSSFYFSKQERNQFNTDEFHTWKDNSPLSSKNVFTNRRSHDVYRLPYPDFATLANLQGLGANRLSLRPSIMGAFTQGSKGPIPDEARPTKKRLTRDSYKTPYSGDVLGDAIMIVKRPKISSSPPIELQKLQKKDLPLKDAQHSSLELGIQQDVDGEGQVDLDLSLHL